MALDGTRLGAALLDAAKQSYLRTSGVAMSAPQEAEASVFWTAIAAGIVAELIGNADVAVTVDLNANSVPPPACTAGGVLATGLDVQGSATGSPTAGTGGLS